MIPSSCKSKKSHECDAKKNAVECKKEKKEIKMKRKKKKKRFWIRSTITTNETKAMRSVKKHFERTAILLQKFRTKNQATSTTIVFRIWNSAWLQWFVSLCIVKDRHFYRPVFIDVSLLYFFADSVFVEWD